MKRLILIIIFTFIYFTSFTLIPSKSDDIIGTWLSKSTSNKVTIFKTGSLFYGKISWLKNINDETGKPKVDENNPDANLRTRHILGLLLLKGFEYNEKNNEWVNGEIYDPKNGKTYSCIMKLNDHHTLEVRGFIGISLIGRTEVWTRSE